MPLIIDCYNLLHQDMPADLAGLDTPGLCQILANSSWQGQRVVVVCDGSAQALSADAPQGIEVIYSGPATTADDVIIELINNDSAPRRITVVSSDRQIGRAARRRKASWVTSEHFVGSLIKMINQTQWPGLPADQKPPEAGGAPAPGGTPGGGGKLTSDQVDRWLDVFEVADLAGIPSQQKQSPDTSDHDDQTTRPPPPVPPDSPPPPNPQPDDKPFLDVELGDADDQSILDIDENDLRSWGYFRDT